MFDDFIRSFTRAWGRGLGYQAARQTGWILVPVLVVVVGLMFFGELVGIRGVNPAALMQWVRWLL